MTNQFPPLRPQSDLDRPMCPGWWIVPAAAIGIALWAVLILMAFWITNETLSGLFKSFGVM